MTLMIKTPFYRGLLFEKHLCLVPIKALHFPQLGGGLRQGAPFFSGFLEGCTFLGLC